MFFVFVSLSLAVVCLCIWYVFFLVCFCRPQKRGIFSVQTEQRRAEGVWNLFVPGQLRRTNSEGTEFTREKVVEVIGRGRGWVGKREEGGEEREM